MSDIGRYADQAALVGRLFYSVMFLLFGYGKITAYAGTVGYMSSLGLPAPSLVYAARHHHRDWRWLTNVGWLSNTPRSTRACNLCLGFRFPWTLATWGPESVPALHEEHGDGRRIVSVRCLRRRRLFNRREKIVNDASPIG